jgi:death-on-curing protein
MIWMEKRLAFAIHDRQLAEHGGSSGVRDERLLESALARPQQLYAYGEPLPDLADLAASLACGIARNHPFVDGNKRTAIVCCETFIEMNSGTLVVDDAELFPVVLAVAEGKLTPEEFATWLRGHIPPVAGHQVQETASRYQAGSRKSGATV